MRPAEYTAEAIIAAGEAIEATGSKVTVFALRKEVGGGNVRRLRQVWEEHVASKRIAEAESVAELPIEVAETVAQVADALSRRVSELAVDLNSRAVKAAERRVAEVIRSADAQRAQAELELADAAQTVDDLEASLEQMSGERDTLKAQLAEKQIESQRQAVELAQLRERLVAAESSLREYRKEVEKEMQRGAERVIAAEKARDESEKEARTARETTARFAGQVEALQVQNARLLESLGSKMVVKA
ncbi:MAG TPA: DNA-binding protein [Thauera sp.]|uniref:DNA-binding protein n=1 Tax=Thauera sp. WH-1 TaxID=3398230 RepID=UPI002CCFE5AE|nr:DNA-binding protein [Thauera sp.]